MLTSIGTIFLLLDRLAVVAAIVCFAIVAIPEHPAVAVFIFLAAILTAYCFYKDLHRKTDKRAPLGHPAVNIIICYLCISSFVKEGCSLLTVAGVITTGIDLLYAIYYKVKGV